MNVVQPNVKRLVLLVLTVLISGSVAVPAALAARSSKPREIVVVGSKVKEVVREAGLETDPNFTLALSQQLMSSVRHAMHRAERNQRFALTALDLDCPVAAMDSDEELLNVEKILQILPSNGFEPARDFFPGLNASANQLVAEAIARATANGRSTVRPYDL